MVSLLNCFQLLVDLLSSFILGSGEIDFDEFAAVMADQFYKKPSRRDLEAAFKYFDTG